MQRFKQTAITSLDSYKIGHPDQYPENLTKVVSNFTPRSDNHFNIPTKYKDKKVLWAGLQELLLDMNYLWNETFFDLPWENVEAQCEIYAPFVGPNGFNTKRLKALHELGYLPLEIRALQEGTLVTIGTPCMTITNTHAAFGWLPNNLETWISSDLWKCSTSATTSRVYKRILDDYSAITGGSKEFVTWQMHDFSLRGMSGIKDGAKSGFGHLIVARGTDNIPAVKLAIDAYGGANTFIGGSVPATEHSIMCSGRKDSEEATFRRIIETYPSGVVSIVSDTWSLWNVLTVTAPNLKDLILNRVPDQFGLAKVVFRPDSGDPVEIICGIEIEKIPAKYASDVEMAKDWALDAIRDRVVSETDHGEIGEWDLEQIFEYDGKYYLAKAELEWNRHAKQYYFINEARIVSFYDIELTPKQKGAVQCLAEVFGTTTNDMGYKTLNQRVGLIYGDSITPERMIAICSRLADKGYASDNLVYGIGSYTFQYQTRDTLGWAMKATYVELDGIGEEIFKDPITDSGTKRSAKGLLRVDLDENGNTVLKDQCTQEEAEGGLLQRVFLNGALVRPTTLAQIREKFLSQ